MASDSFQYRAVFEYKRERGDDISLQLGDLLTVPKASLTAVPGLDYQDGDERSPKGWLHGTNERTKEKGDFPGTFVEYVGVVRLGPPAPKSWPRPVPPTPGGQQAAVGAQPPGAAAASGECCPNRIQHIMWMFGFSVWIVINSAFHEIHINGTEAELLSVLAIKPDVELQYASCRELLCSHSI